jgi:hypothetical protein
MSLNIKSSWNGVHLDHFFRLNKPETFAMRLAVLATFLFLLATPFRVGWTTAQTDFPNYYTAARLVRQGKPLRAYYDWTWFVRQMNYAGNGMQIGAYTPQTPLTMLPIIGLASLSPQQAKQAWLLLNLAFLIATAWLLSTITRFSFDAIWLLGICGYFSLRTNFLYGQYYIFLLFLLTVAFVGLHRGREATAGTLAGVAFALKLYGGPFLFYFAARRQWKAVFAMTVAILILLGIAIALFGYADVYYYATQILPRTLEGGSIDPYHPGVPTFSTFLRHTFVAEPELNPHPFRQAPVAFFFLRTFVSLSIITFLLLGTNARRSSARHDFAWFVIAALLLSTSTASYTFILLLLPLVLLLDESGTARRLILVVWYVLLTLPLHPVWLFPKVWLLAGLFVFVGYPSWHQIRPGVALAALAFIALCAFVDSKRHMTGYEKEPAQRFEHIAVQGSAIFSSFPVISPAGLFVQSMGQDRYVLRWLHENRSEELSFAGHALRPRLAPDGVSIDFELVANRTSTMMRFDPSKGHTSQLAVPTPPDSSEPITSPDGKWEAFETIETGSSQVGLRNLSNGSHILLTGGDCNNSAPAWEPDSKALLFASDCGRAFGLPSLYRASLPGTPN